MIEDLSETETLEISEILLKIKNYINHSNHINEFHDSHNCCANFDSEIINKILSKILSHHLRIVLRHTEVGDTRQRHCHSLSSSPQYKGQGKFLFCHPLLNGSNFRLYICGH